MASNRSDSIPTKWGIVSAGKICHDFVTAVRSIPGTDHQIVAVAARQLESAQAFAKLHNIPKSYGSYEELAKDPDVQVVYVGNISSHHHTVGKLMLEHDKPVLMEKPLAVNSREVEELLGLARQKKLFFMEALWSRYLAPYIHMMKEIDAGNLGDILNVTVSFGLAIQEIERVTKKAMAGGSLLDIGIYCVNAICLIYNGERPEKIAAVGHLNNEGVDESLSVSLRYSNGRIASFVTSTRVELPCELFVVGTKGTIKLPKPMWCPTELIQGDQKIDFPLPPTVLPCNFTNSSGLRYEAMEVRRCLNEGLLESPGMTHKDSELFYSIMDEIRRQVGVEYPQDRA